MFSCHCSVEVWLVAFGRVREERELRYAKDVSVYILHALLPHGPSTVVKNSESQAIPQHVSGMHRDSVRDNIYIFLQIVSKSVALSSVLLQSTNGFRANEGTVSPLPIPTNTMSPFDMEDTMAPSTVHGA